MMRIACLVLIAVLIAPAGYAEFKAAISIRDVTPDPLLPVSGGVGPGRPSTEAKGNLTVRALVLENNGTRVAICSADFLGFPTPLCNRVREKVSGVPAANILIGATHSHSGPDMYGFSDGQGGTAANLDYIAMVCEKLADAINEAVANLQPASMRVATGEAKGKIAYNYYAPMLYDPRCTTVQFIGADESVFATLVNYAIHPEVLGNGVGITSPDMVGPLYDRIAEKGGGVGIFMNGAQGGMITADNRVYEKPKDPAANHHHDMRTWEECIRIGHLLGDEALRIVQDAPIQTNPELTCAMKQVPIPIDNPGFRMIFKSSVIGYEVTEDYVAPVQVNLVNLGDAQMLTIPGEALPNIGYYLKRNMGGEHNMILGLTNDAIGYILVPEDFESFKRYEYITRTSMGEMTGEILINAGLAMVAEAAK
jgi:hypothetical protein